MTHRESIGPLDLDRDVHLDDSSNGFTNKGFRDSTLSTVSKRNPSEVIKQRNGSVVLGKDGASGNTYYTRYHIDHSMQRSGLCKEIMAEECFPCHSVKSRRGCWLFTWAVMRSEAMLFLLHMLTIVLGSMKEAGNYREKDELLHLIHSVVETFVSMIVIAVRVGSAWTAFYHIKKGVKKMESLPTRDDQYQKHHVQGRSLRRWAILLTILGIILELFLITSFLCLYYKANLGWTILTNQFALVVISISSELYMLRVVAAEVRIREDQHKAVLYESILLLKEMNQVSDHRVDSKERKHLGSKTERFCKALKNTDLFEKPDHIKLDEDLTYRPAQGLTFNAMLQSYV